MMWWLGDIFLAGCIVILMFRVLALESTVRDFLTGGDNGNEADEEFARSEVHGLREADRLQPEIGGSEREEGRGSVDPGI